MLREAIDDDFQKMMDLEVHNQSLSSRFGWMLNVINVGGIGFGGFVAYKSFLDRARLTKFLYTLSSASD